MPRSLRRFEERPRLLLAAWLSVVAACGGPTAWRSPSGHSTSPTLTPTTVEASASTLTGASNAVDSGGGDAAPGDSASPDHSRDERKLAERFRHVRAISVQRGKASYYSDEFAGRATASGVAYQPDEFTAAHGSLPFGSVLRVVRIDGGQTVYVRVTDRGPYGARGRVIDLSRAAAEALGMLRAGVIKVRVEGSAT